MLKLKSAIAICLCLVCFLPQSLHNVWARNEFTIENNVLIDYNGDNTKIVIPYGVTEVQATAFLKLNEKLEATGKFFTITFPDSVNTLTASFKEQKTLLEVCFNDNLNIKNTNNLFENCTNLETVHLPKSATLGDNMFKNCTQLIDVNIPSNANSIGVSCFENCIHLPKIVLTETVTSIGDTAFWNCKNLRSISFTNKITRVGMGAFYNCERLRDVFVPKALKQIEPLTFFNCDTAFGYGTLKIPEGVTHIGNMAFGGLEVSKISIPKTVTSLGETTAPEGTATAFKNLDTSDEDLVYFSSYSSLRNLKAFSVAKENPKYSSSDGVLYNKNKTQLLQYPEAKSKEKYRVKKGVTLIARGAFAGTYIAEIVLPQGLKTIEAGAFANGMLKRINIPTSVKKISEKSFGTYKYFPTFEGQIFQVKVIATKNSVAYKYYKTGNPKYGMGIKYIESGKKPEKVTSPTVVSRGENSISLEWNKSKNAVGYTVYAETSKSKYKKIKDCYLNSGEDYFGDNTIYNLISAKKYTFKIRGFNYNSEGEKVYGKYSQELKVCTLPKSVKNVKLNTTKNKLKISWSKVSRASGYQITYATNSKFTKGKKVFYISGNKNFSKTIDKLKQNKTYYVKIRAYKTLSGKKYYGSHKTVKIKV